MQHAGQEGWDNLACRERIWNRVSWNTRGSSLWESQHQWNDYSICFGITSFLFCRNKGKLNKKLTVHVFSLQVCLRKQKSTIKKKNVIQTVYDKANFCRTKWSTTCSELLYGERDKWCHNQQAFSEYFLDYLVTYNFALLSGFNEETICSLTRCGLF